MASNHSVIVREEKLRKPRVEVAGQNTKSLTNGVRPSGRRAPGASSIYIVISNVSADCAARASGIYSDPQSGLYSDRSRNPSRPHALGGRVVEVAAYIQVTPAGLERAIPGSVGRCLIHRATGPVILANVHESVAQSAPDFVTGPVADLDDCRTHKIVAA